MTGIRPPHQGDIMIVDDHPANLLLLEEMLLERGYEPRSFPLGRLALNAARRCPPDLILLDVNMPEMDGYEVCEHLKAEESTAPIPVIFLSAQNETEDKVRAFRAGAADYISKPFQLEEVYARVETHLQLHGLQRELRIQNEHLEEAVVRRTRELHDANQRLTMLDRSKNEFLHLISHELRTPLNGVLGVTDLILLEMRPTPQNTELQGVFERCRHRMMTILDDALLLTQIDVSAEQFRISSTVSLDRILTRAIDDSTALARLRNVTLHPSIATPDDYVVGNEELLIRAFHALFSTAIRLSATGESIRLVFGSSPDLRTVIIESRGPQIPEPALSHFFDLFSMGTAVLPGGDLGLAPAVASRILSFCGSTVTVENRERGIRLSVLLKAAVPALTSI